MKKKFLAAILCLLLSACLVVGLTACKEDEPEPPPAEQNKNIQAEAYASELASALSNSIIADLSKGFNIDICVDIAVKTGEEESKFSLAMSGNINDAKDNPNNDLQLTLKQGENILLGFWYEDNDIYVQNKNNIVKYPDTTINEYLVYIKNKYVPNQEATKAVQPPTDNAKPKEIIEQFVPFALQLICVDNSVTDYTSNIAITKDGNIIKAKIFGDNIIELVKSLEYDIDLSKVPKGLVFDMAVDVTGKIVKTINIDGNIVNGDSQSKLNVKINTNNAGILVQVKDDFKCDIPEVVKTTDNIQSIKNQE